MSAGIRQSPLSWHDGDEGSGKQRFQLYGDGLISFDFLVRSRRPVCTTIDGNRDWDCPSIQGLHPLWLKSQHK